MCGSSEAVIRQQISDHGDSDNCIFWLSDLGRAVTRKDIFGSCSGKCYALTIGGVEGSDKRT